MPDEVTTVGELKSLVQQFVAERNWQPFHDAKNLSMSLAIEAAELMEHFQWLRSDQLDTLLSDPEKIWQIKEEAADVFAYLLSFAHRLDIDLSAALTDKMIKNAVKYPANEFRGRFQ